MRVFVTGAPGYIGRAVVQELLSNGHQVLGLARSDKSADIVSKAGADVHRGDLEDLESLKSGAKAADGVIHLAFHHDFSDFNKAAAIDVAAIKAMSDVMAGTGNPFVIASGTLLLPKGEVGTEDTEPLRDDPFSVRNQGSDLLHLVSKESGIRGSVVRLSPTCHGIGDGGFVTMMMNSAKKAGHATYIGDGSARWPAIHHLDAAVLFRLALEKGRAGATYIGAAEQGIPTKDIAEAIGRKLGISAESKSLDDAVAVLGFLAYPFASDNPVSSEKTQKELGWKPAQVGLLEDIEANYSAQTQSKYS